jgi:hypothetical protein
VLLRDLNELCDSKLRVGSGKSFDAFTVEGRKYLVESPNCICGITETVSHFLLDCPRHTTLRQQLFFSRLDIPETISLKLLIFGSVNLNDEENKAVFKSVQTFIIKSKRFTPSHAHIQCNIFHLFNLIQSLCIIIFK